MQQITIKDVTGRVAGLQKQNGAPVRWGINLCSATREEYVVTVTPDDARWVLDHMHPGQRRLSQSHWGALAALMESGDFLEKQEPGICFNRAGYAVNARHRLMAQEKMCKTYDWRLSIGLSDAEVAALDQVRVRRIHQSINLVGNSPRMSHREEAAIKTILDMKRGVESHIPWSLTAVLGAREAHAEELEWAMGLPTTIGPACLVGAFAFAYPANPERVRLFGDEYRAIRCREPGVFEEGHPALLLARSMDARESRYGTAYKFRVTNRALYCLMKFCAQQTISRLSDVNVRRGREWFAAERQRLGII